MDCANCTHVHVLLHMRTRYSIAFCNHCIRAVTGEFGDLHKEKKRKEIEIDFTARTDFLQYSILVQFWVVLESVARLQNLISVFSNSLSLHRNCIAALVAFWSDVEARIKVSGGLTSLFEVSGRLTSLFGGSGRLTSLFVESGQLTSLLGVSGQLTSLLGGSGQLISIPISESWLEVEQVALQSVWEVVVEWGGAWAWAPVPWARVEARWYSGLGRLGPSTADRPWSLPVGVLSFPFLPSLNCTS